MTEEEVKDVNNQEAVKPDTNSEDQGQDVSSKQSDKELNFAKLREKVEVESREKMELTRQVEELLRREQERVNPKPQVEVEEQINPDDILTAEQSDKRSQKIAEATVKKFLQEKERTALPDQTRKNFNDFDVIMTKENIEKLEKEEPGLADACSKANNPWEATYKILKKFVLPQTEGKISKAEEKLNNDSSAPVSSNSVGNRGPLSNANAWAEQSKDDLYKEMIGLARKAL